MDGHVFTIFNMIIALKYMFISFQNLSAKACSSIWTEMPTWNPI